MLLDIETRTGELLPPSDRGGWITTDKSIKQKAKTPEGITVQRAHQSRAIAHHPEIVERVKAQARENEGNGPGAVNILREPGNRKRAGFSRAELISLYE